MHADFTVITFLITAVAIELDKFTQFTHPTLHAAAFLGMAVFVFSLVI